MAFEDIEEDVLEYWNPENIGDNIEGNVYEITTDQWNNKRIVLDMGDDEDGNLLTTTLPGHAHLQRFVKKINVGDYIRVELVKLIEPKEETDENGKKIQPTRIYKVQKDPERKIDYDE